MSKGLLNQNINFRLNITAPEWDELEKKAKADGKSTVRGYIRCELYRFAQKYAALIPPCSVKKNKRLNYYKIPPELRGFYRSLACHLNCEVGTAIFRFIILPNVASDGALFERINLLPFQESTTTAAPSYTSTVKAKPSFTATVCPPSEYSHEGVPLNINFSGNADKDSSCKL